MIRVTANQCRKYHRAPWRKHISYGEYLAGLPTASEGDREILDAVMALPKKYRLPIYLFYFEEYSTEEIAEILKIPKGTVCSYLSRGREQLKMEIQEGEENE